MDQYFYSRYLLFSLASHTIIYTIDIALITEFGTRLKPNVAGVLFIALMPSFLATKLWRRECPDATPGRGAYIIPLLLTLLQTFVAFAFIGLLKTFRPQINEAMMGNTDLSLPLAMLIFFIVAFFGNRFGMRLAAPEIFKAPVRKRSDTIPEHIIKSRIKQK